MRPTPPDKARVPSRIRAQGHPKNLEDGVKRLANGIMDEILSTPVEEITRGQVRRWQDELLDRSTNAKTDEEFEYCEQLADALGRKLTESIDSLPPDEQDEVRRILPKEKWAAGLADDIKKAKDAGEWRAAKLLEEMLQEAFDQKTITRH